MSNIKISSEEEKRIAGWFHQFAQLLVHQIEAMTPEQRKILNKKIAKSNKTTSNSSKLERFS